MTVQMIRLSSLRLGRSLTRRWLTLFGCALLISAASPDDRRIITGQMQELSDAIATGDVAVWDKYLDPSVIYAEEDDTFKGKADALKEITPLPNGLSGTIRIALLSYHEEEGVAIALFRQIETEHYFGQTIYANYLTSTTWKKRADGWKLLAAQVLAEKADPPSVTLTSNQLSEYVGTYTLLRSRATYTLAVSNGMLIATRNGRTPTVWNAEACDVFFVKGEPRIRNIFQRDQAGQVNGFVERREMWDIVWVKEPQG
jgi:ketosteroid isomerase-like protein